MSKIVILDENTSNKIAAGEVIERPASVVKELVENSIDAGASNISVEIKNGGIAFIKVNDNGCGIEEDDAEIAFERHATSKIRSSNDLESIATLGFRGEALASIAAVSEVELATRVSQNSHGMYVKIRGGTVKDVRQTGCPVGTSFIIRDLFFNTPARFKFLKKDSTEAGYVSEVISRIALGNPQISFRLSSNNSTVIHTPGNNDLLSVIFSIYGKETAKELCEIKYSDVKLKITGYAGKPEIARSNRNQQTLFINGRYVKSKIVVSAIDEAYKTFLLKNKFPFVVMNVELNPLLVDVNVHPTKMEVRFSDDQEIFRSVYHAVSNALMGMSLIKTVEFDNKRESSYKMNPVSSPQIEYDQQKFEFMRNHVKENPKKEASIKYKPCEKVTSYAHKDSEKENLSAESNIEHLEYFPGEKSFDEENKKNTGVEELKEEPVTGLNNITVTSSSSDVDPGSLQEMTPNTNIESINNYGDEAGAEENIENTFKTLFNQSKIIGQAFSTYIILQQDEDLLLIDQHAAHERIMYERLKSKYANNENVSQMLIAPVVVELTHQEIKFLDEIKDFLNKLGFIFEDFGNNSIILRSVPYIEESAVIKQLFLEVLDYMMSTGKTDYSLIEDDTLYTIACKAAVKANKKLDQIEIQEILKGLSDISNPYTCPHGRPTLIKISKYELEKKFKRII